MIGRHEFAAFQTQLKEPRIMQYKRKPVTKPKSDSLPKATCQTSTDDYFQGCLANEALSFKEPKHMTTRTRHVRQDTSPMTIVHRPQTPLEILDLSGTLERVSAPKIMADVIITINLTFPLTHK
jgi:hypothetical protein